MNYRHIYHAGNFADVAKHVALAYCLSALKRKEAAFFVLDTHAGRAAYDLNSAQARKSAEADRGIQRLLEVGLPNELFGPYLEAIGAQRGRRLESYRGSPAQIAGALRAQDRAVFVELLPAEARAAGRQLRSLGRIRVEIGDGFAALKAVLPPAERRGLVLLDPPYESAEELKALIVALDESYRRWSTGTFLVWYPILSPSQRSKVHARFAALRIPKTLAADLALRSDETALGLAGSGLIIINPPFGADAFLDAAYASIHAALATGGEGYVEVTRLTPERMAQ